MCKGIGIIIKARKVFNEATLLSLYNSLILPYLSAAVCLKGKNTWHAPETCHGLAKQSCAVIAGASPRTNVDTLYPELAILPVKRVFAYTTGISIYKLNAPRIIPGYVYVYNDHLMGYFFAFWSSSRWPLAQKTDIVSKSKLVPSVFIKIHHWINHRG